MVDVRINMEAAQYPRKRKALPLVLTCFVSTTTVCGYFKPIEVNRSGSGAESCGIQGNRRSKGRQSSRPNITSVGVKPVDSLPRRRNVLRH